MSARKIKKDVAVIRPMAKPGRSGSGSKFVSSILDAYTPDDDFSPKHRENLVRDFDARVLGDGKTGEDLVSSANILEVNRFGVVRVRKIKNSGEYRAALAEAEKGRAALEKLIERNVRFQSLESFRAKGKDVEAEARKIAESAKFREDFGLSCDTNAPSSGNPFDEFIPIMGGPFNHQQYLHDFLDGLAKSFEASNHNPLAHQIIKLTTYFVLGRGVTFQARNPLVHEAFADWWKRGDMVTRLEFWSDALSQVGELAIRKFYDATGELFVRWIDSSTIWEIVTDLEDIERVYYYHQQYPTQYQVLYGAPAGSKFNPSKFDSSKYVINQIPADEVIFIKANVLPNEKRGRGDLFSILGWLKRYKDFQTAVVLRAIAQASFAWKNKLQGTATDVNAFIAQFGNQPPQFGSVWTENDASTLEPMAADIKSGNATADCPGIINAIATGSGIPKEYLGLSEHATRATAVVASEPGVKKFQARQLLLGRVLCEIADAWAKAEIAAGRLPALVPGDDEDLPLVLSWVKKNSAKFPVIGSLLKNMIQAVQSVAWVNMVPLDTEIEFHFPEIAVEDRTAKMADIQSARDSGDISHRRAATMRAKELGIADFDHDKEQEEIMDERANDAALLYSNPLLAPPGQPGAPAPGQPSGLDKGKGGLSAGDKRGVKNANS